MEYVTDVGAENVDEAGGGGADRADRFLYMVCLVVDAVFVGVISQLIKPVTLVSRHISGYCV